jgi:hypothetical protein
MLQGRYRGVTRVLLACYKDRCYRSVTATGSLPFSPGAGVYRRLVLSTCNVTEVSQKCHRSVIESVTEVLQKCYRSVTEVSQKCYKGVTKGRGVEAIGVYHL